MFSHSLFSSSNIGEAWMLSAEGTGIAFAWDFCLKTSRTRSGCRRKSGRRKRLTMSYRSLGRNALPSREAFGEDFLKTVAANLPRCGQCIRVVVVDSPQDRWTHDEFVFGKIELDARRAGSVSGSAIVDAHFGRTTGWPLPANGIPQCKIDAGLLVDAVEQLSKSPQVPRLARWAHFQAR